MSSDKNEKNEVLIGAAEWNLDSKSKNFKVSKNQDVIGIELSTSIKAVNDRLVRDVIREFDYRAYYSHDEKEYTHHSASQALNELVKDNDGKMPDTYDARRYRIIIDSILHAGVDKAIEHYTKLHDKHSNQDERDELIHLMTTAKVMSPNISIREPLLKENKLPGIIEAKVKSPEKILDFSLSLNEQSDHIKSILKDRFNYDLSGDKGAISGAEFYHNLSANPYLPERNITVEGERMRDLVLGAAEKQYTLSGDLDDSKRPHSKPVDLKVVGEENKDQKYVVTVYPSVKGELALARDLDTTKITNMSARQAATLFLSSNDLEGIVRGQASNREYVIFDSNSVDVIHTNFRTADNIKRQALELSKKSGLDKRKSSSASDDNSFSPS